MLDYSLYHLDGTTACSMSSRCWRFPRWTPSVDAPGRPPGGGSPEWYDLYRRILRGGKGVQAVGVELDEVIPLLDAVGPAGCAFLLGGATYGEAEAERLLKTLEPCR